MDALNQATTSAPSAFTSISRDRQNKTTAPAKIILAFIGACALAKLFAASVSGFTGDEAYTVVISRSFQLSYFDHPPLHQWIVHGFSALFGEGWWLCIPFLVMAEAINLPLYGLTRRLFGGDAALWALFGFNATAYFAVWPDGLILPDVPLFLFLTLGVWAVAEILFGPARKPGAVWGLWLAAGAAFGLAGLSKYAAIFVPVGLFGFLAFSPRHRHWFSRPQPYLAAALALAIFSPALIWNYQNDWVSFAFQSGRTASGAALSASAFAIFSGAARRASRAALAMGGRAARHRFGACRVDRGRRQRQPFPPVACRDPARALLVDAVHGEDHNPALVQLGVAVRLPLAWP